jgi:hypothetical protein
MIVIQEEEVEYGRIQHSRQEVYWRSIGQEESLIQLRE